MKKYLNDLEAELRRNNLSEEEIQDILDDHREMIESALNEGIGDDDLESKFGNPKEVAEELSQFSEKKNEGREKTKTMKTKEFTNIEAGYDVNINLINDDIELLHTDENKIVVEYIGKRDFEDYTIEFKGNTLLIEEPKGFFKRNTFRNDSGSHFIITVPKDLAVGDFKLKEVNGDIKLSDIVSKSFHFGTTNGDSELTNIETEEFQLSTINGDLNLNQLKAKSLKVSQISGDIHMNNSEIKENLDVHTVSGDIVLNQVSCKEMTLKTVSGDIKGEEFYPETVSLTSVSGDIRIKNTDSNRPIEIKHKKTVSGDIEIRIKK
ncbi:MAG: DUF4097 family beta strand repeat protein [Bacilli bacterium]|nr:DUF4097 family beta strand repeat protein [Bacilli bacterium]MBN2877543.1 DUF4097 family beta strand repeat protein [Bacilli bacterium]